MIKRLPPNVRDSDARQEMERDFFARLWAFSMYAMHKKNLTKQERASARMCAQMSRQELTRPREEKRK